MKALVRFLSNSFKGLALLCVVPCFLLTITSYMGELDWRFDLTSHFRPWISLIEGLALLIFILLRQRKLAIITLLFLVINTMSFIAVFLPHAPPSEKQSQSLKLIQFNVCAPAKDYKQLSQFLRHEKPDVIVMEECGERCIQHLHRDGAWQQFPYRFQKTPVRHRLVVLSRFPLQEQSFPKLTGDPAIALLEVALPAKRKFTLLAMHSTRPSSGEFYYQKQIAQFRQIAALVSKSPIPLMMVGDLNVSPWNYSFGLLTKEAKLRNSMESFGLQLSFPTFVSHYENFPIRPLVPIDHVLVSQDFNVISRKIGSKLQSDHLPVIVEIGL